MSRGKSPIDGKTIFGYGKTPQESDANLQDKLDALTPLIAPLTTLHDLAKALWYPSIQHLKPRTREKYEGIYINHVRETLGKLPLSGITTASIQAVINSAVKGGNGSSVATSIRSVLNQIIVVCAANGLIQQNPATFVKVPPRPQKRVRVLTAEEASALLDLASGTSLSAPVFLSTVLGLRRGEVAGLKWSDLDRVRGELTIQRQRQAILGEGIVESDLKTTGSYRVLHLTPGLVEQIDQRGDLDSPYICTYASLPWVPNTITEKWEEVRAKWNLPTWRFHDLRHGAAGLLYAAGCDMLQIAAVLGHAKPDMSLLYTDATKERREQAVEKLSESLGFGVHVSR